MARLFFVRLAFMLFSLDMHITSACSRTAPLATRVKRPLMRSVMNFDKQNQIELVLNGDLDQILEDRYGPPPHTTDQIRNSVDFTRAEALEHVRKFGFPPGSYTKGDSPADGIHVDINDGVWRLWYSERGTTCLKFECKDSNVAKEALMDLMIYLSGMSGVVDYSEKFELSPLKWNKI